jgi:hypothetical protein
MKEDRFVPDAETNEFLLADAKRVDENLNPPYLRERAGRLP